MENQNEYEVDSQAVEESNGKKKKKKEKVKSVKKFEGFNSVLAFVAYIGIGCIAVALLLTLILKGNTKLSDAFNSVGEVIAYVICICLAFTWVRRHRSIAWIVCYVIFVVTIVVLFILNV